MRKIVMTILLLSSLVPKVLAQINPHMGFGITAAYRSGSVSSPELNDYIASNSNQTGVKEQLAFRGPRAGYTIGADFYYTGVCGGIRISKAWNTATSTSEDGVKFELRASELHFTPYIGFGFQRNFFHLQCSGGLAFGNNKVRTTQSIIGSDKVKLDGNYDGLFFGYNLRAEASIFYVFFAAEKVFGEKNDVVTLTDNFVGARFLGNVHPSFSGMRYEIGLRFNITDEP